MDSRLVPEVYAEGPFFFAHKEELMIWGVGSTAEEAVDDFNVHVEHFRKYYAGLPDDKVTGEALRLKKLFAELFPSSRL